MAETGRPTPPALTLASLHEAAHLLAHKSPELAGIIEAIGTPPLWAREPGFSTLLYIILEQQVSLASARAAFGRLTGTISPVTPANFLTLDDAQLKAIGFSRQKTAYGRILAQAILDRELDLAALPDMEDDSVRLELMKIKGIGRWTADIYLMEALLRPDVWPTGDLALAAAVQRVKGLAAVPNPLELERMGEAYRPWRAVAARLYWHHYLSSPSRRSGPASGI